jgi:hypothetical protein
VRERFADLGEAHVFSDARVANELDAQRPDDVHIAANHVPGQPILGDPHDEHAGGYRFHFEDRRAATEESQVVCGGQSGRSRSDDRHAGAVLRRGVGDAGGAGHRTQLLSSAAISRLRVLECTGEQVPGIACGLGP